MAGYLFDLSHRRRNRHRMNRVHFFTCLDFYSLLSLDFENLLLKSLHCISRLARLAFAHVVVMHSFPRQPPNYFCTSRLQIPFSIFNAWECSLRQGSRTGDSNDSKESTHDTLARFDRRRPLRRQILCLCNARSVRHGRKDHRLYFCV
jgi:hypothetical protein